MQFTYSIVADRQDRLRHDRIAQHASFRREKTQPSQTRVISIPVDVEVPASRAHASPTFSSHRRRSLPTHASSPLYSRRRHVSSIQVPEVPEVPESPEIPEALELPEAPQAQ